MPGRSVPAQNLRGLADYELLCWRVSLTVTAYATGYVEQVAALEQPLALDSAAKRYCLPSALA
eukprot:7299901-Pyramimonas_sp.AAC.1